MKYMYRSHNPCLPEVLKDAAIYYSPRDVGSLTEKIRDALGYDMKKRSEIAQRAKKRASFFSWEIATEKTVEAFEKAITP